MPSASQRQISGRCTVNKVVIIINGIVPLPFESVLVSNGSSVTVVLTALTLLPSLPGNCQMSRIEGYDVSSAPSNSDRADNFTDVINTAASQVSR